MMVHLTIDMKLYTYIVASVVFVYSMTLTSCYYDIESELYGGQLCDTLGTASYSQSVAPLMGQFCTNCHGGSSPEAGISLETYDEVNAQVSNGKLSCTVNHGEGCSPMPDNAPKIPQCDILEIERWINSGALND